MTKRKTLLRIASMLILALVLAPGIYSAGTQEVEARDLQFTAPYADLDLPYAAKINLVDNFFMQEYDFTIQRKELYSFKESIKTVDYDPVSGLGKNFEFKTSADMTFHQRGLGFADIEYRNMTTDYVKVITDDDTGMLEQSRGTTGPETVIHKGYTPEGDYNYDTQLNFSYLLQYPLFSGPMIMGRTHMVDLPMPVLMNGMEAVAEGAMQLTYIGNAEIAGKPYAKLLGRIVFDEKDIPFDITGNHFSLEADGYGVYYFDLTNSSFYYGNVTLDIEIETASLVPSLSKFREPTRDIPVRTSETSLTLRYERKR
jgi:hypothetical protein